MRGHRIRGLVARAALVATCVAVGLPLLASPARAADDLLADIEVTTAAELAEAITAANGDLGAETITVSADITLTLALPQITGPVTITGGAADRATTIATAGFRLVGATGSSWTEPAGAAADVHLGVHVRNLTLTGGNGGGGSMMRFSRVHGSVADVSFVGNVGGWEGNVYAVEGGTTLQVDRVSVTGQSGTLFMNDHGSTPHDALDAHGNLVLADADFDNRLHVRSSTFSSNTGCVIYTHRFVSIADSTFSGSGSVCLNGVSTKRIARSTFTATTVQLLHPWPQAWGGVTGPAYAQLDDVSVWPTVSISNQGGGSTHLVVAATVVCGRAIESYPWSNPLTGSTAIGSCTGVAPAWTDTDLPALELGVPVDDGVAADGSPVATYSITAGALPDGLALDAGTGALTGTPTVAGDYAFEIAATNSHGSVTAPFTGSIAAMPAPVAPVDGPATLLIPGDGTAGDGDDEADGNVVLRSSGLRITLTGVEATMHPRLVVTTQPRAATDQGLAASAAPLLITAHDVTFDTVEVCVRVDATAVGDRSLDRLRLLQRNDGVEHDITSAPVNEGDDLLVCGRSDHLAILQAVVLAGDRIAGGDRYETAAALASSRWTDADVVYVASGEIHADAMVGGVIAAAGAAPVVLVRRDGIPTATARALTQIRPDRIVVVGGERAVSAPTLTLLNRYAAEVVVLAGRDRYETAAEAAAVGHPEGADVAYLVSGASFADAVVAGTAAARSGAALLLTDPTSLPDGTRRALQDLQPGHVVVTGGSRAVSDAVLAQVAELLPTSTVERIGGTDRYATSLQLAATSTGPLVAATGTGFADVVAAVPFTAGAGASMILVGPSGLSTEARSQLLARAPEHATVVGGHRAVTADSELQLARVQAPSAPRRL